LLAIIDASSVTAIRTAAVSGVATDLLARPDAGDLAIIGAGGIAERLWPLLKVRYNPFFQMQEKIEPWVHNAQRGAAIIKGTRMNAEDVQLAKLYNNFVDKNLINMADNDIAELARKFGWGKGMEAASNAEGGKMAFVRGKLEELTEVQGVKQLNMLRTFKKGLGREMKAVWEENLPGEWEKMLRAARVRAGTMIDDDEFAIKLAAENLTANRVFSKKMLDASGGFTGYQAEFAKAIQTNQWSGPQSLGEMRALNLDAVAERISLRSPRSGRDYETSMQLREGLASGDLDIDDIRRALRDLDADPDYIARVDSALRFSYPEFWRQAKAAFDMGDDEVRMFERMFAGFAERRGMTPVEYMSQVFQPQIINGTEASVGALGALRELTRAGRLEMVPDLAQLRGIAGQTDIADFYNQLAKVMSHHLDPSAKRAFLRELVDDPSTLPSSMADIEAVWNQLGAADELADRMMGFVQGRPGIGAHTIVADEATGIARIREVASDVRSSAGRPRNLQRSIHDDSDELEELVAADYAGMRASKRYEATDADLAEEFSPMVSEALVRAGVRSPLKNTEKELTAAERVAYQNLQSENHALYARIKDDLGIRVETVDEAFPYHTGDAMRVDLENGVLKVPKSGYFHPVLSGTDAFIQRVVSDVFGYGQEANLLGSHDALFSAAALYGDEARTAFLSDTFGRMAFERRSNDIIEQAVFAPKTLKEYSVRYPRSTTTGLGGIGPGSNNTESIARPIGPGITSMPEDLQDELFAALGPLRENFPDIPLTSIDRAPMFDAAAATYGWRDEHPVIVFGTQHGWDDDPVTRAARRQTRERWAIDPSEKMLSAPPGLYGHLSPLVGGTYIDDIYHEFGHVIDYFLHDAGRLENGIQQAGVYGKRYQAIEDFMVKFRNGKNIKRLSQYGNTKAPNATMTYSETFGELFNLAFNPGQADYLRMGVPKGLREDAIEFQRLMEEAGIYVPGGRPVPFNPNAGKTIREVNAEARALSAGAPAAIRAPSRLGFLPSETMQKITDHFIGSGRFAESNPDVARISGFFADSLRGATAEALEAGEAGRWSHIFDAMSGMPVQDRVPFNFTEGKLMDAMVQSMAVKWEDAFRLQYFAQNRSMMQRSINHPMFGLYDMALGHVWNSSWCR
jgi:hypothetical protein